MPLDEALERTDKAIKIVWVPNLDDLIMLDKLAQLYSSKLELLQRTGRLPDRMACFIDEMKPKILNTMNHLEEDNPAYVCLQNNLLIFTVEYLKDLKQVRKIDEGLAVVAEAQTIYASVLKKNS